MTKKEKRYFEVARAVAACSPHPRFLIGCCIVNHHIITVSSNLVKSHPEQKRLNRYRYNPCDSSKDLMHAELAAILKIKNKDDLRGASIYVYRISKKKNQLQGNSRPCPACLAKIKEVGIKTMYYTTADGFCREDLY